MKKSLPIFVMCFFLPMLVQANKAHGSIQIDGILDEPEWNSALVYKDFVTVEPLTGDPAKYATEVRMISNENGIFVGFSNYQPISVKRVNRRFARDAKFRLIEMSSALILMGLQLPPMISL